MSSRKEIAGKRAPTKRRLRLRKLGTRLQFAQHVHAKLEVDRLPLEDFPVQRGDGKRVRREPVALDMEAVGFAFGFEPERRERDAGARARAATGGPAPSLFVASAPSRRSLVLNTSFIMGSAHAIEPARSGVRPELIISS